MKNGESRDLVKIVKLSGAKSARKRRIKVGRVELRGEQRTTKERENRDNFKYSV